MGLRTLLRRSWFPLAVFGMIGFLVVQAIVLWRARRGGQVGVLAHPPVGTRLSSRVVYADARADKLSDAWPGMCRYVVIYSPHCGACRVRASQWYQTLYREKGQHFPADWAVIWVSVEGAAADSGAFPAGFFLPRVYARDGSSLSAEAGVHAVPAYLVLDRDGTVKTGGVGAPLPAVSAFRSDCSVALRSE